VSYHVPVLCEATLDGLVHDPDGLYADCTLGGGGHSERLLARLSPKGRVIGFDRDREAIAAAHERLGGDVRFSARQRRFGEIEQEDLAGVSGFLFDLGVSSHQFDDPSRGFTIRHNVPLDLRMDPEGGRTLADVFAQYDDDSLARELSHLGEVPRAHIVARSLRRLLEEREGVLYSEDLGKALDEAFPRGMREHTRELAKLSMALRMLVNEELPEIARGLSGAWNKLAVQGRLAVITYHSVEDRAVMSSLRGLLGDSREDLRDPFGNRPEMQGSWVEKKIEPSPEEIEQNPRSRSARLRVVRKDRGAALGGVFLAIFAVSILGAILVGQVWRQHRFLQQAGSLDSLQTEQGRLHDSLDLLSARLVAEESPARIEVRARNYGFAVPKDQWRLPDPVSGGAR